MKTVTAVIWNSDLDSIPNYSTQLNYLICSGLAWVIDERKNFRVIKFRSQRHFDFLSETPIYFSD